MKRRMILFSALAAIIVILIIGAVVIFSPSKMVSKSDNISDLQVKYKGSEVAADQNAVIEILSKYDAAASLNSYFPYENDKADFEIYFARNNKPVHILLGAFNIWYESAGGLAHDILNAGRLKEELKEALNLQ